MFIDYYPKQKNIRIFCISHDDIQSEKYSYRQFKECVFMAIRAIRDSKSKKISESNFFMYFWDYWSYYCFWYDDKSILDDIFYETFQKSFWFDYETEWVLRPNCPLVISYKYNKWQIIEFDEDLAMSEQDEKHTNYGLEMIYWAIYSDSFKNKNNNWIL